MLWQAYYSLNVAIANTKTEIELYERLSKKEKQDEAALDEGTFNFLNFKSPIDTKGKLQYWTSVLEKYQTLQQEYLTELESFNSVKL